MITSHTRSRLDAQARMSIDAPTLERRPTARVGARSLNQRRTKRTPKQLQRQAELRRQATPVLDGDLCPRLISRERALQHPADSLDRIRIDLQATRPERQLDEHHFPLDVDTMLPADHASTVPRPGSPILSVPSFLTQPGMAGYVDRHHDELVEGLDD
jgi:hypothetical protein